MIVIDRDGNRIVELAQFAAWLAEPGHERAAIIIIATRKYLHSMIGASDEQEASMMVERQASRPHEDVIAMLDRELDASIAIETIGSHAATQRTHSLHKISCLAGEEMVQTPNTQRGPDSRSSTRGSEAARQRNKEAPRRDPKERHVECNTRQA